MRYNLYVPFVVFVSPDSAVLSRGGARSVSFLGTTPSSREDKGGARLQDDDGQCIFGKKSYWDTMYLGEESSKAAEVPPAESYSWYCGWSELEPFWTMLNPSPFSHVLIAGIGNDPTPVDMYDAGYTHITAYDYSQSGVDRAKELFGHERITGGVRLLVADARNVPIVTASVDATLDKGTLDAIYITGKDVFYDSVKEMGRVTAEEGIVVSISKVIEPEELLTAFDPVLWNNVHNGSLAFAPDGEATIDLGAELYSWKRSNAPWVTSS